MPRLSTTANGAVHTATPRQRATPATPRLPNPPSTDVVEEDYEDEVVEVTPEPAVAPATTGAPAAPAVFEAIGPNGESLTMELGKDGVYRTVATNVPPPPISAEIDHPLLSSLRARTNQPKQQAKRLPAYNNPYLWYMKTDGEIVNLQGDPGNRAYYEEKGYVVLRSEEVNAYLKDKTRMVPDGRGGYRKEIVQPAIRRLVLAEQRKRANLITTIRNIALKNPSVELAGDLSITPTEELELLLQQLKSNQSINFTLLQARQRVVEDSYDDTEFDQAESGSGLELERKLTAYEQARSGTGLIPNNRLSDESTPALPGGVRHG